MDSSLSSEDILDFWFGTATDNLTVAQRQSKLWWSKSDELDRQIRERFEPLLLTMAKEETACFSETAGGRLAQVILFDQFPRNMYRGTPAAFATDPLAQKLALSALSEGDESQLRPIERVFLYMPLNHAEDRRLQALSVERFQLLRDESVENERSLFEDYLNFATRHRDIVARFGRFPHRNAILGRQSTPEEVEFLKQPGSSF